MPVHQAATGEVGSPRAALLTIEGRSGTLRLEVLAPRTELLSRMAAAVLASAALAACAPEHESELLEVRHVAPERIEPGQLLRIHGEGFPPGRNGRVRLEGNFHAPGASARRVELDLEATAVSTDEVEVP